MFRIVVGNADISHALVPFLVDSVSAHQPRTFPDFPVIFRPCQAITKDSRLYNLAVYGYMMVTVSPKGSAVRNVHHAANV